MTTNLTIIHENFYSEPNKETLARLERELESYFAQLLITGPTAEWVLERAVAHLEEIEEDE